MMFLNCGLQSKLRMVQNIILVSMVIVIIPLRNFPRIEEKTSDKFFTWGWQNNDSKFKPAFIFNTAGKKKKI